MFDHIQLYYVGVMVDRRLTVERRQEAGKRWMVYAWAMRGL
jgi:hypothetical protein